MMFDDSLLNAIGAISISLSPSPLHLSRLLSAHMGLHWTIHRQHSSVAIVSLFNIFLVRASQSPSEMGGACATCCRVRTVSSSQHEGGAPWTTCCHAVVFNVSAFHIQAPGIWPRDRGTTGGKSGAGVAGSIGAVAMGSPGTSSDGVPRILLINSASILCTSFNHLNVLCLDNTFTHPNHNFVRTALHTTKQTFQPTTLETPRWFSNSSTSPSRRKAVTSRGKGFAFPEFKCCWRRWRSQRHD